MLLALLLILIVLWVLGFIPTGGILIPNITFFTLNGHDITLWNFITLAVISWIIAIIPRPFSTIASILLVVWIFSILGFLPFIGLSSLLMLVIILGLVFYLIWGVIYSIRR